MSNEFGAQVAQDSDDGFPWQMSVRIEPTAIEEIAGRCIRIGERQGSSEAQSRYSVVDVSVKFHFCALRCRLTTQTPWQQVTHLKTLINQRTQT